MFLDEPYTKTMINLRNIKDPDAWLYACEDGEEILSRSEDTIPQYMFGKNPFLREFADKNGIPLLAVLGGGETLHPGFAAKAKQHCSRRKRSDGEDCTIAGPQQNSRAVNPDPNDGEIHVLKVQGNVYMLVGDGGNIAVEVGRPRSSVRRLWRG